MFSSFIQVVYVTATLPLILLGAMFFRGVNLPGFQQGLALLFVPEVWIVSYFIAILKSALEVDFCCSFYHRLKFSWALIWAVLVWCQAIWSGDHDSLITLIVEIYSKNSKKLHKGFRAFVHFQVYSKLCAIWRCVLVRKSLCKIFSKF